MPDVTVLKPKHFAIRRGEDIASGSVPKVRFSGSASNMKMIIEVSFKPAQFNKNSSRGKDVKIRKTTGDCAVFQTGTNILDSQERPSFLVTTNGNKILMEVGEILTTGDKGNHGN